ncbi:YIP1 family protein [Chitinimonas koreensis]|uniref:YIP1 family protein n=1 Tax=Chitinimonas koreensis TaxID=356302 RepID=UPI0003FB5322|nr:YIP1 family protein [Chitinimonas koreensis]QNM98341.1 YIP1 family protein [Chitinimonas koreensis]
MQLLTVFTEPARLFDEIKEKPGFPLPFVLFLVAAPLIWFLYYQRVDGAWLIDHIVSASDMKPSDAQKMREGMSLAVIQWATVISTPIVTAGMFLVMALYYKLAGKVAGVEQRFTAWFSFASWTAAPGLLSLLVMLINVFIMTSQTSPSDVQLTHVDPLLVNLPLNNPWKQLLNAIDLLSLWSIALTAIGWRQWSRGSWTAAIIVALLPLLVIFGGWALAIAVSH